MINHILHNRNIQALKCLINPFGSFQGLPIYNRISVQSLIDQLDLRKAAFNRHVGWTIRCVEDWCQAEL